MEKIFEDAKDQHVAGTFVYVKSGKAYSDSECKNGIDAETLKDLFYKGVLIVDNKKEYKALFMSEESGIVKLTYLTADSSTPTTAKLVTLQSVASEE